MVEQRTERKYEALWRLIRDEKELTIQLQPPELTKEQATKQFKTIKKAISKEKYQDIHYRSEFPDSKLSFSLDTKWNKITFVLEDDCKPRLEDF